MPLIKSKAWLPGFIASALTGIGFCLLALLLLAVSWPRPSGVAWIWIVLLIIPGLGIIGAVCARPKAGINNAELVQAYFGGDSSKRGERAHAFGRLSWVLLVLGNLWLWGFALQVLASGGEISQLISRGLGVMAGAAIVMSLGVAAGLASAFLRWRS